MQEEAERELKLKIQKKLGIQNGFRKYIKNFKGKEIYKGFVLDTANKFGIDSKNSRSCYYKMQIRPDIKNCYPTVKLLKKRLLRKDSCCNKKI